MEDNRPYPDVLICTLQEKVKIARQGLQAIIDQSPDISSNRKIAETTLEEISNI